jgi:hypothetical protein
MMGDRGIVYVNKGFGGRKFLQPFFSVYRGLTDLVISPGHHIGDTVEFYSPPLQSSKRHQLIEKSIALQSIPSSELKTPMERFRESRYHEPVSQSDSVPVRFSKPSSLPATVAFELLKLVLPTAGVGGWFAFQILTIPREYS